jgi:soluble lytic murein transglycosylase
MNQRLRPLSGVLVLAVLGLFSTDVAARGGHKAQHEKQAGARHHGKTAKKISKQALRPAEKPKAKPTEEVQHQDSPALTPEQAAVKSAIDLVRKSKIADATALESTLVDPAARKLIEWFILRQAESDASFSRYAAFITDNPDWPGINRLQRKAEARLWQERRDSAAVRGFLGDHPASGKGKLALARMLLADGDREGAARLVRQTWQSDELSERNEVEVLEAFPDILTRDDHRARMDKRIGAKDFAAAKRAAKRLGNDELAIVKACASVNANSDKAIEQLDAVAPEARSDLGYTLCRTKWMLRHDRIDEAARLMLAADPATMPLQDTDEWWRERRTLARKLLDQGKAHVAYEISRQAVPPANEYYRADFHFMSGWIALRYLNEPMTAQRYFRHVDDGSANPIVLARANYWRGRAAEAIGDKGRMRASYEAAACYPTAYYGQLARARLGLDRIELRAPLPPGAAATDDGRVRAADMLYALGERDLVLAFVADLAERSSDVAVLIALGELTARHNDARAMLQIGKLALARGLALDHYAFPTIGIPPHNQIGPPIERSVIYSVARTESAFDQGDKSAANAVGLMQVTPDAGRDTAKRFGVSYDWDRMVSDPVYNTQMGAAELSALLSEYRGSHLMTFAGYNAGRGRVRDWVKSHGDPRDPSVDAVDWVERIPFSETRNYVQRVMENLQVYRVRLDRDPSLMAKSDQRPNASQEANSAPPTPASASR